ncbi:mediator of RNA polymerase II transcription subunit 27 isoform X9 [Delphinapterus leucas]|uniref:Mediator of RNA polymerase II transcription subunit 27 n=1 Tax=Delphinapterus leucas TaxID=9749 RepID=A0A2Y9NGL9_DELLE|nr:mediator of RNA polymerase II transcription subunit 27 isoform X9 [Delphinapterus leucas]
MADVLSVGVNLEAFAQAISAIQALRSSVSRVFDCLKDGMRNKETLEGREKAFIAHFQDNLHSVNRDLNELERLSNLVGKPSENHPLHNSGLLSLDPVQDKTPLYSQLLQAYKWSNKRFSPVVRACSGPAHMFCRFTCQPYTDDTALQPA